MSRNGKGRSTRKIYTCLSNVSTTDKKLRKHIETYKVDLIAEINNLVGQERKIFFGQKTEAYLEYQYDIIDFFEKILTDDKDEEVT